jgi:hypothetical protein
MSPQRKLIPFECNIMIRVPGKDPAGKKENIFHALRSAIYREYRKYAIAKKLKSAGPSFIHERCISFVFDYPNPPYGKVMTYRLQFGPFLEPINLSKVENEYFDPTDFEPRKRKQTAAPIVQVEQPISKQTA